MKKFVLAPALAALAMFVFGAVFWMSPFPYQTLKQVGDSGAVALSLAQLFPTTGTYVIPGREIKDEKLLNELFQRGPSAEVYFVKEGHAPMEPAVLIKGYLHYLVVAVLLAFVLQIAGASFRSYAAVVRFCALVGVIGATFICLSGPIWWYHSLGWHVMDWLYSVLGLVVAGLVLGIFFKPERIEVIIH